MANTATTGYVGMDTSPVQNAINNTQTNMNSQVGAGVLMLLYMVYFFRQF